MKKRIALTMREIKRLKILTLIEHGHHTRAEAAQERAKHQ